MMSDIRFAIRLFLKSPWISLVAILSLALGIGANLAAFGIARTILWQPLAVPEPDRLIVVYNYGSGGTGGYSSVAFKEYEYFRDHNGVLSGFAAYLRLPLYMRNDAGTERVIGEIVTSNFFSVMGAHPILGRAFQTGDDRAMGTIPEAVLAYDTWLQRFGGNPNVIGAAVRLGGYPFNIIGVAGRDFRGVLMDWQQPPDIWIPMNMLSQASPAFLGSGTNILNAWQAHSMMVVGRLKPAVTVDQAAAAFITLGKRMSQDHPERLTAWQGRYDFTPRVLPIQQARFFPAYRDSIVGYIEIIAVVVVIVLGIACLNLANLMIARAAPRRRELAVRAALGAGRFRLLRQLIIESLLLSIAGVLGGLLVAAWAWQILSTFGRPFRVALPAEFPVDPQMWAIAIGLSLLTGILFGAWPARRVSRFEINAVLKQETQTARGHAFGLRSGLIVVQVALSVVLLVGAGLLAQTVRNARSVDRFNDRAHIGLVEIDLVSGGYSEDRARDFFAQLLREIRAVPGIQHASLVSTVPLAGQRGASDVTLTPEGSEKPVTFQLGDNVVSTDYFNTLAIPILRGRDFMESDAMGTPGVAVINETMAHKFWPGADPLGQPIYVRSAKQNLEIVGVVKDTKGRTVRSTVEPAVFRSAGQFMRPVMNLQIHTDSNPASQLPELRRIVRQMDPDIPLANFRTMEEHVDRALSQERLAAVLLTALGAVALGLTLIGLYGIVAFTTAARTREIGIRMAVGARSRDRILRIVSRPCLPMASESPSHLREAGAAFSLWVRRASRSGG